MAYLPYDGRYDKMVYHRCGRSGIMLPAVCVGLWKNFGGLMPYENSREMVLGAFDMGITHFDLANNYGPPAGSAEETFGRILQQDLRPYRDELIISTKAGYTMWPGPYGDHGSKKYLVASLDQSLKRMGLDYVDIFYHHRPDPDTPLEESMDALAGIVKSGKALYAGLSNYPADLTRKAADMLHQMGVKVLIHQPSYSMFNRWVEDGLLDLLDETGIGCIAFSPLGRGVLNNKYLPAGKHAQASRPDHIEEAVWEKLVRLNDIAAERGQTLAQLALAWLLKRKTVTSVLIGASRLSQIQENVEALQNLSFTPDELARIEGILKA